MLVKIRFLLASLALAASLVLPPSTAVAAPAGAPSPGTVTASAPFQHLLPANSSARVLTYSTTREDGSPVAATATLYEPTAAWTHGGPRPTIVFAPGTRGQGDQCAPSRSFLGVSSAWPGSVNFNYEYQFHQAAEFAEAYGPDLNVRGTYAGAPPADLERVMHAVNGSAIAHVLGYAINGFAERDPQFRDAILANFNDRGKAFLRDAATSCIGESVATWGFTRTQTLTAHGESLEELSIKEPIIGETLRRQKLGQHTPNAPIYIANSPTDDLIPYGQARALAGAYCQAGATVNFVAEPGTALAPGAALGHAVPLMASVPKGLVYLFDLFTNKPAPNNCA
ncbi:lipase family protein [Corynebacterium phoceense]|uniref:lipase family protein n=1 Tax=Corynebacterium phoceense TaxID=1686286 RepID=UPI00211B86CF|nr:lipase family protein [Corynebacterium phoceense]MCQ9340955.1 lipase family protein [Corynebacterium phoceense]